MSPAASAPTTAVEGRVRLGLVVPKALALLFLTLAAPLALLLFWLPLPAAGEVFTLLAVGFPVALIVVGASRNGRLGPLV